MSAEGSTSSEHRVTRLTVGLVTLNEEGTISASLGALLDEIDRIQTRAEIIVVAGGQDNTIGIVRKMLEGRDDSRLIVDDEPKGKPAALNLIFSNASGDIVLLSDGDVVVGSGAIEKLLRAFDDSSVGCVSGRVLGGGRYHSQVMRASSLMNDMMHMSRRAQLELSRSLNLASGYLIAFRRDIVDKMPTGVKSDDGYISCLALQKGYRIAYVEDAVVYIKFPRSASDFIRQKMRTRFGHMQLEDYFGGRAGRTALAEVRDFARYMKAAKREGPYGSETLVVAFCLTALCWLSAYSRRIVPFLFKSPVWQPVKSTK